MKDPIEALKNGYQTALQAKSVSGFQVPFYKILAETHEDTYYHVMGTTVVDDSDKEDFQTECTITIGCVAPFNHNYPDVDKADEIANQALQTINVKAGSYIPLTGFFIITTSLDNSTSIIKEEPNGKASVRILRFRHIIGES